MSALHSELRPGTENWHSSIFVPSQFANKLLEGLPAYHQNSGLLTPLDFSQGRNPRAIPVVP